ncbi:hypothetical protein PR048_011958 [Dryococelus australis]|uniref:Uncharacterized protein n=1 Tax=Dryococelus australis TaxID=614101 RepID=A0ABQ9HPA8_9NEOP|nr:hypothetical protein PR048_011958 [Dryococelus australis]
MKPQPETYKCNVIKRARVEGLEHENYKEVYAQAMKTDNDYHVVNLFRCKQRCFQAVSKGSQMAILSKSLVLINKDTQDLHLQHLIEKNGIETMMPRKGNARQCATSFSYFIID